MMEPLLTKEERKAIDGYFKTKEYRILAHELMNWNHEPSIREGRDLAGKYGITTEQMRRVIRILKEKQLFTKAEGSIPLYRRGLRREAETRTPSPIREPYEIEKHVLDETVDLGEPDEEVMEPSSGFGLREPDAGETPEWPSEEFETMKLQVKGLQTGMNGLGKHLEDIKDFMAQITAQQTANPAPVEAYAEEDPMEATDEIEKIMPSGIEEIANPLRTEELQDEVMELKGHIFARKTIGFTSKSLMIFDLSKAAGFPGNIADFVNTAIADVLKGRNKSLALLDRKFI